MEPDLYEVLQVHPTAEPEVIDAAFRRLTRKYHPDVNPSPDATEITGRLSAAYQVLRDPDRRAAYDRELAARRDRDLAARQQQAQAPTQANDPGQAISSDPDNEAAEVRVSLLGGLAGLGIRLGKRRIL